MDRDLKRIGKIRTFHTFSIHRDVLKHIFYYLLDDFGFDGNDYNVDVVPDDILKKLQRKNIIKWDDDLKWWIADGNYTHGNRIRINKNCYVIILTDDTKMITFITVWLYDWDHKQTLDKILNIIKKLQRDLNKNFYGMI